MSDGAQVEASEVEDWFDEESEEDEEPSASSLGRSGGQIC